MLLNFGDVPGTVTEVVLALKFEGKTSLARGNCGGKLIVLNLDIHAMVQFARQNRQTTLNQLTANVYLMYEQAVSSRNGLSRTLLRGGTIVGVSITLLITCTLHYTSPKLKHF